MADFGLILECVWMFLDDFWAFFCMPNDILDAEFPHGLEGRDFLKTKSKFKVKVPTYILWFSGILRPLETWCFKFMG